MPQPTLWNPKRYKKLKRAIEKGEGGITLEQIQVEQAAHTAISDEAVDIAVDNAISFMMNCTASTPQPLENVDELALAAAIESSVLLKNQNDILPLSKNKRIALIGSILPEDEEGKSQLETIKYALTEKGYNCVGTSVGYDMSDIQKNHLIDRAIRIADSAGVVILFLGFGSENEKNIQNTKTLELPANQLHLANALIKRKKTVIGIIAAGHAPDIAFTRNFKAVLLAPLHTKASVNAIVSMLTGEVSPAGKLAYTLYAGSNTAFQKRELYKQKYGLKSGPFVGYRYYDTANITVGYPFGHGLSYTSFVYTDLAYTNETVSFTVENKGHMPASEVAQVYIGANSSSVLRPKKELCGFVKLYLAPQEKKRVSLPIDIPKVYQVNTYLQERGEYTIFVGASSMDIRLSEQVRITGQALQKDSEAIRHYIQSVPNLLEDHFTLEAKYHPMKNKSQKNLLIGLLTLILAIGLATFNTATELYSTFIGVVGAILGVLAIFFLLSSIQERSKSQKDSDKMLQEKNKEYFQDAEQLEVLSTQKMFSEEFDASEEVEQQEVEAEADTLDAEISKYVDTGFKLHNMVADLLHFCEERGFKLNAGVAENIVSSLASSKLLILEDISSEDFNGLMLVLSEYFSTKTYVDKIEGEVEEVYDLFFSRDHVGDAKKKASVLAMEDAARAKEKIHLLCVDGLTAASFEKFIKPFTTYITSQKSSTPVKIFNSQGANVGFNVLQNVKLILRLANDVAIDTLPASILRVAACASIAPVKCQVAEEHLPHHGCNRYQLEYMYEKESSAAAVSENIYKKVDKLESYVASHCDYSIGNKLWLAFEKQIGLLLSAKKETAEAVDSAIALRILPSMMAALNGHLTKEDESLQATLEFIFGEENVAFCVKFISTVEGKHAQNSISE